MIEFKSAWELLWYGGIALTLLGIVYLLIRGDLVPRVHHVAVVEELRKALATMTEDRDEWRAHAKQLDEAVDRLAEAINLKSRGRP